MLLKDIVKYIGAGGLYLVSALAAASVLAWLVAPYLDFEPVKIVSRLLLLCMALGLIPLWRVSGMDLGAVGLKPYDGKGVVAAFTSGVLLLLPLLLFFVVSGYRVGDDRVEWLSTAFLSFFLLALPGAVLVGIFEETLFRGFLSNMLETRFGVRSGIMVSSLLYASVHFLSVEGSASPLTWYAGFTIALQAFGEFGPVGEIWDSFIALFLLGVLFCVVRRQFGLWCCIALHAAWVLGIRVVKEVTVRDMVNPYGAWVGSYDNFVGLAAIAWLLFIFVVLALARRAQANAA